MLKDDVARRGTTKWASPVVLAPEKNGSLRLCADCRKLNANTARDSYTIQQMNECIDCLGTANVLQTLDENSSY